MSRNTQEDFPWRPVVLKMEIRLIEHYCSKINEGLKYNTLIETNIQGEPKYRDKKGKEYTDVVCFRNRTKLREI